MAVAKISFLGLEHYENENRRASTGAKRLPDDRKEATLRSWISVVDQWPLRASLGADPATGERHMHVSDHQRSRDKELD